MLECTSKAYLYTISHFVYSHLKHLKLSTFFLKVYTNLVWQHNGGKVDLGLQLYCLLSLYTTHNKSTLHKHGQSMENNQRIDPFTMNHRTSGSFQCKKETNEGGEGGYNYSLD